MEQGQGVVLEMSLLARQLNEQLPAMNSSPACVIGKVNARTRNVDEDEYNPEYVSIGPYHYCQDEPLAREADKAGRLRDFLSAGPVALEDLLSNMEQIESCARRWYVDEFPQLTAVDFARMLLLDGCYILEQFGHFGGLTFGGSGGSSAELPRRPVATEAVSATPNGAMQGQNGRSAPTTTSVARRGRGGGDKVVEDVDKVRDVWYLAENQIPFFVIEEIHRLSTPGGSTSAVERIEPYARELLRGQLYATATPVLEPPPGNLLHLLHMHLTSTTPRGAGGGGGAPVGRWRTATQYSMAGVAFKKRDLAASPGSILDVKLADSGGGALEVPLLNIDGETWRLLRNLVALEQRNPEALGTRVTAYCIFMSQVACTAGNVAMLSKVGVLSHLQGHDGEVADYFAGLCKGVVFDVDDPESNYLRPTYQALERRFQSRPRKWMAWLKRNYFRNPWVAVGLAAAAIVFACAVVQAVYSALSYYKGAK